MTGVVVVGQRHAIEPPVLGDCEDPKCRSVASGAIDRPEARVVPDDLPGDRSLIDADIGRHLLLVATYFPAGIVRGPDGRVATFGIRLCAACDLRHLRARFEYES